MKTRKLTIDRWRREAPQLRAKSASGRQTLTLTLKERQAGKLRTSVLLRFTPAKGKQRKALRKTLHVTFP